MNPAAYALSQLANGTAPAPKRLRRGDHEFSAVLDGFEWHFTYDLRGNYYPASDDCPADYPEIVLCTVSIGGETRGPDEAQAWLERLDLWCDLDRAAHEVCADADIDVEGD